ncbi:MAG: transposase [Planctomycetia bacterium]|nr:transposase [Planctomycetia bacterium]
MLYLGIDLHEEQITINLRDEKGKVVLKQQVSTNHAKINDFFDGILKRSQSDGGYMAILEVCGFHEWLIEILKNYECKEILLVQADTSSNKKTDRRDANVLAELLWNNRFHIINNNRPNGLRRVYQPNKNENEIRQLANLRPHIIHLRTKVINKVRGILRKQNKIQGAPSKDFKTKKVRTWLEIVGLFPVDH